MSNNVYLHMCHTLYYCLGLGPIEHTLVSFLVLSDSYTVHSLSLSHTLTLTLITVNHTRYTHTPYTRIRITHHTEPVVHWPLQNPGKNNNKQQILFSYKFFLKITAFTVFSLHQSSSVFSSLLYICLPRTKTWIQRKRREWQPPPPTYNPFKKKVAGISACWYW